ncbi:hypothetical protein AGOR_G00059230 [Albula goreensis]|uniref:Cordon-bleu ubiquitin-like domain-containing protein n=1 Tax=Albula goreensis TaxID=1534307 RepID=A0A8T3DY27_9TELE|nr:hypothetical protein AGOR_G00059230 [Albula goreensis]
MDQKENLVDKELTLGVVLPGGVEKTATVHGSKPVMDLLVILCAKYRLNPSSHTIELSSPNGDCIKCKPHALIGALEVEKILIKPKGAADKKQGPKMPEATVRLVINYKKTHKTVLRVSPRIPLGEHMPAVCAKCELDLHTAVLLRNASSKEPLELTKSLDDLGLREVYAVDEKGVDSAPDLPASPKHEENKTLPGKDKVLKEKENKGLFSIFKRSKKKPEQVVSDSAPASPVLKDSPDGVPSLSAQAPTCSPNATLSDVPKKRRAPLPPMTASQSAPSNLSDQQPDPQPNPKPDGPQEESGIGRGSLKSSKRKAPPPPSAPCIKTTEGKTEDKSIKVSHLKEISEQEEVVSSVDMDTSTCDAGQGTNSSLSLSTASSVDCGKTDIISPPVDIETRETSPSEVTGEDPQQSDLASHDKPAMDMDPDPMKEVTEEIMNAEEPSTSEMEDRAGLTSDSAASEVECQPGESALAPTEESLTLQCQSEPDSSPVSVEEAEVQTVPPSEPRRQYTPRPGLTTYTIVPSKSADKLKYFEGDELGEETVTTETSDHAQTDTASSTTAAAEAPEADGEKSIALSTNGGGIQTGPTQEKKIPPAIKPKPGSFHILKHKRVPGEYVISAATKHVNPISDCSENEDPATKELVGAIEELSIPPPPPFPPPPPPPLLQKEREAPVGAPEQDLGPQETSSPGDDIIRSSAKEQPVEMSLEKLASFAAPKPYVPVKPSRFAQTVSSAARKRAEFFAPLYRSLSQPPGSFMSETEAEERSDGRAPELQGTDDPGCGSDSRSSPQRTGLRDPGETPAMHGDAEPCTVQVIDLHTVPEALSPMSLNSSIETEATREEDRYRSPSCHMTPLEPHGRN